MPKQQGSGTNDSHTSFLLPKITTQMHNRQLKEVILPSIQNVVGICKHKVSSRLVTLLEVML
jgi:hypothetical protein